MRDKKEVAIDSLKARIPIRKCKIIDESIFGNKLVIDETTQEVEDEFKSNRYKSEHKGITTSFVIQEQNDSKGMRREYLVVLFNSKTLKESYLDGITNKNLKRVYDYIIDLGVVSFSWESFLQAECTDVDFKLDAKQENQDELYKELKFLSKPSKEIGKGMFHFNRKDNQGIQFGERSKSSPSYPFMKFYNKTRELINNSETFYNYHLRPLEIDVNDILRIEFTIKNKKHFKRYKIEDTTLDNLVSLSDDKLHLILNEILSIHLDKKIAMKIEAKEGLNPSEQIVYNSILVLMKQDQKWNYNAIREILLSNLDKQAKYRKGKEMDFIYDSCIKDSKADKTSKSVSNFLEMLGLQIRA